MRHQWDILPDDRLDLRHMARAAFQLHRLGARFDQASGIRDGRFRRVVGADGKIGHEQRPFHSARGGPGMMEHFLELHLGRIGDNRARPCLTSRRPG